MAWVELHQHSQYSILDSTAAIQGIAAKASSFKMSALALTDQGNLYGAVDFYKACKKLGFKPIIGCELFVAPKSRHDKKQQPGQPAGYPIVILAKNKKGYQNLCKLSSIAHLEGFYYIPRIDKEILLEHSEGLICLSGPMKGPISQLILQQKQELLQTEIQWYQKTFKDDFYLEVSRHRMDEKKMKEDGMDREGWLYQAALEEFQKQDMLNARLKELGKEHGIACVATNDSRYLEPSDWQAHEILMNIQSGEPCEIWEKDSFGNPKNKVLNPKRKVLLSHEHYFKSPQEMDLLFADFQGAVQESVNIAEKCHFELDLHTKYYPVFVPKSLEGKSFTQEERTKEAENFLKELCGQGIEKKYDSEALARVQEKFPGKDPLTVVKERLSYELELITSKGMCDYLLIVYDFIDWAKSQGIPMGPGRGSGAGSIVCYLTGITEIEPLRFNLFFERFINPERISYPDLDVDICMDRRFEVIDYTMRKYGKDKVAQIITFGTMKAKMAIKDVGRTLNVPLAKVNQIAKLVPEDLNITLEKALEESDLKHLYETDEETKKLLDLAKCLEGCIRSTGTHAAGIIISADPIIDHIPVCMAKDSSFMATQYSMKPVEEVGMLKIDFLGLKTLTAIQVAVSSIENHEGSKIDWVKLHLNDKATFELLNQGKTLGVFQLESSGMQELSKQLHIDKFEEIIAVGALYRPGPMEMIPSFINRKHKREQIEIDHPLMAMILSETYGIMVYQEQVMQIASMLANYTLGEGDVLRRAMGKKDKVEMAKQREKFRLGALKNNISEATSMLIFDKVEKFASYGFNKSHAAAYGYLSYVTAYFKANYPMHWMAALMTTDRDDTSKVAKVIGECQSLNIPILPPDVNESENTFVPTKKGIRFALSAIKGVGEGVVEAILEERKRKGTFSSLYDFFKRMDTRKVGKKVVEILIEAGCFDFTKWGRRSLIESIEPMYQVVQKGQKDKERGVMNFFALIENEENRFGSAPDVMAEIPKNQVLRREKELLGFYLTGHPLEDCQDQIRRLSCMPLKELDRMENGMVCRTAFIIDEITVKTMAKNGRKFALIKISDGMVHYEIPIWPDLYEEKLSLIKENQLAFAVLQIEKQDEEIKIQCRYLDDLTKIGEDTIKACDTAYDKARMSGKMSQFRDHKKNNPPSFVKKEESKTLHLKMDAQMVKLSHILQLKELFRSFPGQMRVNIEFLNQSGPSTQILINAPWGIEWNEQIEKALSSLPVIKIEQKA